MEKEIKNSPFKFLDPYQKKDSNIFFGREEEVEKLYQYVNKNRLVLVYGPSGSGKTSVIQCGLSNRFEVTDWIPFFIRRGHDINASLFKILSQDKALGGCMESNGHDQLLKAIELISSRYLRPVYLIFDQFEEVLILGKESEKAKFIDNLKKIVDFENTQPCNIVFSLREEYFAWLQPFEEAMPGFSDRRLRVEPMRPKGVSEVILKSCEHFNIKLQEPDKNVQQIIDIVAEKKEISLPYLQVYLDQIWKDDFKRTYPQDYKKEGHPPLEFTTSEIKNFGDIKDVFERFLAERKRAIQQTLRTKFTKIDEGTLNNVLDAFVTEQGTKFPVVYTRSGENILLKESAPDYLEKLPAPVLTTCLTELETNRILRDNGGSFELAHDTLAALIDQQRTDKQRRLNEIRRQIRSAFQEFPYTKEYLTAKQIRSYEDSIDQLDLEPELIKFFNKSRVYRKKGRIVKLALWVLVPVTALLLYFIYHIGRVANRHYALFYLGYKIDSKIDSMKDKMDALYLAKYIYDRHDVTGSDSFLIRQKFLKLFQLPEIQSKFSFFHKTIGTTNMKAEDFDISQDGSYVVLNDSSQGSVYKIIDTKNGHVRYFSNIKYAYFTNRPDKLLLASSTRSANWDSLYPQFNNYSDMFILYDCRKQTADSINLKNGYLHLKEFIDLNESEYDSYRVRYTASGNIVVPFLKITRENWLVGNVRLYMPGKTSADLAATSSTSISKDGKSIMTGHGQEKFLIDVYNEWGKHLLRLSDVDFADFTEKGSVISTRYGTLILQTSSDDTSRRFEVDKSIKYAYAGGDETVALTKSDDYFYKVDLQNGSIKSFKEKLIAVNFNKKSFITLNDPGHRSPQKENPDTLRRRQLSGDRVDIFICSAGIRNVVYNQKSDEILLLTNKHELLLLEKDLKKKAGFQLTWNDLYGFSKNGNAIFYVRDNSLCVFNNDSKLISLFDFDKAYKWLLNNYQRKTNYKKWRMDHDLTFPTEISFNKK